MSRKLKKRRTTVTPILSESYKDYPPVLTKIDFVRRYALGEFGNASPTADSPEEFYNRYGEMIETSPGTVITGYNSWDGLKWTAIHGLREGAKVLTGKFHLRNRTIGGKGHYNLPWSELIKIWKGLTPEKRRSLYISAMAPHDYGTIQGELERNHRDGLYLYYNTQPVPMREGFEIERLHAYGSEAHELLIKYFNPLSYDWVMELLYRYPYHVIEFSAFGIDWGTVPGHNVAFWEVRGGY